MTVSKLTSISLCDKANTVQDSISKANRGFNSTESILCLLYTSDAADE